MRYTFLLLLWLFVCGDLISQKDSSIRFKSYNSVGVVAGKSPVAFTAQTINGVTWKKWFTGIGFGLDNYFMQTLPLFGSVRRDFGKNKFQWFLYADVGGHFITKPNNYSENSYTHKTKGNMYIDGGAGVKIPVAKTKSIFFSFGNTYKQATETTISNNVDYPSESKTVYSLSRLSIRVGFQF